MARQYLDPVQCNGILKRSSVGYSRTLRTYSARSWRAHASVDTRYGCWCSVALKQAKALWLVVGVAHLPKVMKKILSDPVVQ